MYTDNIVMIYLKTTTPMSWHVACMHDILARAFVSHDKFVRTGMSDRDIFVI